MADRETVIVERKTNPLAIVAGIVLVVAVALIAYLIFFGEGNENVGGTADVDVPAVSVEVVPDGE
ncbi:hypothetical protein GCM10007989_09600 [Devosia pacifica]|uniref:Uncharacterized protein n=1 Tax=Devosia pacifica TaxID=1335967 RepID=A0A918RZD6_9HYPH|nr:hypothetical protein [Devosia pacifica]GHA16618.1 hypothetical protein GCM10007989_09600 [Devosia pacifica]